MTTNGSCFQVAPDDDPVRDAAINDSTYGQNGRVTDVIVDGHYGSGTRERSVGQTDECEVNGVDSNVYEGWAE